MLLMFVTHSTTLTLFRVSDLFTNVAGDTILTFFIEINVYTKILLDRIHSKYLYYN